MYMYSSSESPPAMMMTSSVPTATVYITVVLLSMIGVFSLQPARAVLPCYGNSTDRESLTHMVGGYIALLHVLSCTNTRTMHACCVLVVVLCCNGAAQLYVVICMEVRG